MEAPDVACTRQLHRDGVHSHHNKDEDTEVHSGNVELHDNSSNTASNAEESFLLGNFGSFLIEDPQLRGLVLKFFSIIAVVQIFIFAFTSWHIIQSSLIDPAHLSTNPEFIYEQLKKAEKPVSHLVPARGFNTLDLVAIYVSSSASPSISYSVFSKQLSEFVESKRPILSHIWGDNFQVYTLCLNWTNRPALINELIPLIVEKTGRTHSTSDTLHYVFVDDAHFKPSTKVVDGFGIIDYHSQSSGISDFVPSFLVKSLFQVAIGRTLEHHRLSAAAHEQIHSKLSDDMELADYCQLLIDTKELAQKELLNDRPQPDLMYLSIYLPILSSVVLPVPMFIIRRLKARRACKQ